MNVYIVTSGCYSDYTIDAVFTDKKKAEMYCAMHPSNDQEIEEWETEDASITSNKPVYKRWIAKIYNHDGSVYFFDDGYCFSRAFSVTDVPRHYYERPHRKIVMTTSTGKTNEQAKKIMFDKLAAWNYKKETELDAQ